MSLPKPPKHPFVPPKFVVPRAHLDVLELPAPVQATPERRESLHHHFKLKKSVSLAVAWTAIVTVSGWIVSSVPYVWSWEKHQVTDEQLGHVLYDAIDPKSSKPKPVPNFDEASLPPDGVVTRLMALEESKRELEEKLKASAEEVKRLRELIVDQYRWRVRMQAASSEPDPRKRKDSSDRSEAIFKRLADAGKPLDEAYRRALERNPYE